MRAAESPLDPVLTYVLLPLRHAEIHNRVSHITAGLFNIRNALGRTLPLF